MPSQKKNFLGMRAFHETFLLKSRSQYLYLENYTLENIKTSEDASRRKVEMQLKTEIT